MNLKNIVRKVACGSLKLTKKVARKTAHRVLDFNALIAQKTMPINKWVMRRHIWLTCDLSGCPRFSKTAIDTTIDMAFSSTLKWHNIMHQVLDGRPLLPAWDDAVKVHEDYMREAVPILVESITPAGADEVAA